MCLKSPRMSHFNLLRQEILLFHTLEIFRKISTPERYILPKLEVWYVLIILSTDLIDMHIMNLTRRYRIKTRSLAASCLMSAEHHLFHYHMQIEFKEFPVKYNQSSRIILHWWVESSGSLFYTARGQKSHTMEKVKFLSKM